VQAQDPALVTRSPRLKSPSVLQHSQHAPLQDHLTRRGHTTSPPATAGRGSPTGTAFSPGTVIWGGEWAPRARMFTLPPFEVKWLIFVCEARVKKSDAYQVHDVLHSEARQVHVRYYCFYVSSSPSLPTFPPSLPPARSCSSAIPTLLLYRTGQKWRPTWLSEYISFDVGRFQKAPSLPPLALGPSLAHCIQDRLQHTVVFTVLVCAVVLLAVACRCAGVEPPAVTSPELISERLFVA